MGCNAVDGYSFLPVSMFRAEPPEPPHLIDLMMSFIPAASAFGFPFIEPFLTDDAPDYTRGVNFAFSGALALPYGVPYYFEVQVSQFATFKARALCEYKLL